jgi:hypothetical protein
MATGRPGQEPVTDSRDFMRTWIRAIALPIGALAVFVQFAGARVDVKIDFDKSFDFKAARSWGWAPAGAGEVKMARTQTDDPDAMKKFAEPPIVDSITREMVRLKLEPAPANPDLIITYYLLLTTNQQSQSMGQFLPATMSWGLPLFPQATSSLKVLNQGALVIDMSAKGAVVWRGVAQAQIKIDSDVKKREALLREGVRDLLRRFPPKV